MDNKETLKQNNSRIDINNTDLASILITINNLPKYEKVILQEKNVTPNTEIQEIVPDVGYTGLSKVNVDGDSDLLPENIKKGVNIFGVDGEASVADFEINDCTYLFYNGARLGAIDSLFALCKNVVSMFHMFHGCKQLKNLDLSSFDTSNVTNMEYTFQGCNLLMDLNLSNFDTSNVTNMQNIFYGCEYLQNIIGVNNFNTSKVTNMYGMFYYCSKLTSLDLSNFDTSNVTNMVNMFYNCKKLTHLDIRNFTFNKVTSYSGMLGNISTDCLIIVKGDTEKEWITSKFTTLTNVKTVAEL